MPEHKQAIITNLKAKLDGASWELLGPFKRIGRRARVGLESGERFQMKVHVVLSRRTSSECQYTTCQELLMMKWDTGFTLSGQ